VLVLDRIFEGYPSEEVICVGSLLIVLVVVVVLEKSKDEDEDEHEHDWEGDKGESLFNSSIALLGINYPE
jgi:hypothetical protein